MPLTVFDTFTGTANTLLSDHTPDIGGTWYDGYNSASSLVKVILNGSGAAVEGLTVEDANSVMIDVVNDTVMPGLEYYVEVDVNIPAGTADNTLIGLIARYQNGPLDGYTNDYVGTIWWTGPDYYRATGELNNSSWGDGSYPAPLAVPLMTGTHTLRLEVDATESRTYIDGVLKQTTPLETNVPLPGRVGFTIAQDMTPADWGIEVLEFRAGELTFEPTYFWTNRQRSTETPT